jgi:hypothetical protein
MQRAVAICLVFANLVSFSCFAEAAASAEHNAYFHCQHTRQKVERTKHCPCGCNKKKKAFIRLVSADDHCESDDVVAHAPEFEKLFSSLLAPELIRGQVVVTQHLPAPTEILTSYFISPPVPPG